MTDTYNNALNEQLKKNVWDKFKQETQNMSKMDKATTAADIIGIFDPTPVSDIVGGTLSAAQGDLVGASLSVASLVPYAGDAAAKPLKIAKTAPKTAQALQQMLAAGDKLASAAKADLQKAGLNLDQVAAARKMALEKVQRAMLNAKQNKPCIMKCKLVGSKGEGRQLQMPQTGENGQWKTANGQQPKGGNGTFEFREPRTLPDGRKVKAIEFKNGAPDFDKYVEGKKYDLWEVSGNANIDAKMLKKQIREVQPDWLPPIKEDFVLHHFENGKVGYVPKIIHDKTIGGISHTGGNSMINNKLF